MLKEIISTGKTVDEAVSNALTQYSLKRDQIQLEILERGKSSFFGLIKSPAKVKISFEIKESKETRKPREEKPKQEKAERQEKAPKKAQSPKREEKPRNEKPQRPQRQERQTEERPHVEMREGNFDVAENTEEIYIKKAKVAKEYVESIIKSMGISEFFIDTEVSNESIVLSLEGDEIGFIIGRRGETLDSIQYLAGLATNKLDGEYVRISINSGSFREKRKKTLEELAERLAATVKRTSRNITLEPMNPYERRIIHSTVSKFEGVTSRSIGEEPNRRVVISSTRKYNGRPRRGGKPYHKNGYQKNYGSQNQNQDNFSSESKEVKEAPIVENKEQHSFNDSNRKDFSVNNQAANQKPNVPEELKTKPLYSKIEIY